MHTNGYFFRSDPRIAILLFVVVRFIARSPLLKILTILIQTTSQLPNFLTLVHFLIADGEPTTILLPIPRSSVYDIPAYTPSASAYNQDYFLQTPCDVVSHAPDSQGHSHTVPDAPPSCASAYSGSFAYRFLSYSGCFARHAF